MQIKFEAGDFSLSTWTEGHPMWMELKYNRGGGITETFRFHHSQLKNLGFIVDRMLSQARAQMPEPYKHEFD